MSAFITSNSLTLPKTMPVVLRANPLEILART